MTEIIGFFPLFAVLVNVAVAVLITLKYQNML